MYKKDDSAEFPVPLETRARRRMLPAIDGRGAWLVIHSIPDQDVWPKCPDPTQHSEVGTQRQSYARLWSGKAAGDSRRSKQSMPSSLTDVITKSDVMPQAMQRIPLFKS